MFAPVKNISKLRYSDDESQYEHRFPTPDAVESTPRRKLLGQKYSFEDMNRGLAIINAFICRRDGYRELKGTAGSSENNQVFPGYAVDGWEHQVENLTEAELALRNATEVGMDMEAFMSELQDENEARRVADKAAKDLDVRKGTGDGKPNENLTPVVGADAFEMEAKIVEAAISAVKSKGKKTNIPKLAPMRRVDRQKILKELKRKVKKINHDEVFDKTKAQLIDFSNLVNDADISSYISAQVQSDTIVELSQKPEFREEELRKEMAKQYDFARVEMYYADNFAKSIQLVFNSM